MKRFFSVILFLSFFSNSCVYTLHEDFYKGLALGAGIGGIFAGFYLYKYKSKRPLPIPLKQELDKCKSDFEKYKKQTDKYYSFYFAFVGTIKDAKKPLYIPWLKMLKLRRILMHSRMKV